MCDGRAVTKLAFEGPTFSNFNLHHLVTCAWRVFLTEHNSFVNISPDCEQIRLHQTPPYTYICIYIYTHVIIVCISIYLYIYIHVYIYMYEYVLPRAYRPLSAWFQLCFLLPHELDARSTKSAKLYLKNELEKPGITIAGAYAAQTLWSEGNSQ